MRSLELAAARNRFAHAPVGEKLVALLLVFSGVLLLPPLPTLPLLAGVVLLTAFHARVPWRLYGAMIIAPASFLIPGLIPLVVTFDHSGLLLIEGGLVTAATVLARSTVAMSATMLFALTTPMSEQLMFARKLHLPDFAVHMAMLTYTMIGSLVTTAQAMLFAQSSRLGFRNRRRWIASSAAQAASLFVVAFARARRLQEGLELRADPTALATGRTQVATASSRPSRIVALLVAALIIVGVSWFTTGNWIDPGSRW
ncbi:cobalt ECF transporter T component CbiQ [Corynebacterium choanae]|uniref:Cobalt transport protein CbiQ n=1 Tax=Corynebacterium choanae TaxID=1862358 RepID=A0A3G6J4A2_9CORY|nr:cobalt ECF transporter T component CbiQ [Corynebacterium choanae]AZA12847.1 Cobalt transport protein CbiQ [Corynebacterium choanae]